MKAEKIGADIVAVTGFECGGHPGNDDVCGNIVLQRTCEMVKNIPIVFSAGVVDGKGLVSALAMGADGVEMATRFIVCDESPAHPLYKQHLIDAQETDTMIIQRSIKNPSRVMKSSGAYKVLEMEARGATLEEMLTIISGKVGRKALFEADLENCTFSAGQSVGLIHHGGSVQQLFDEIMATADESLARLRSAFEL